MDENNVKPPPPLLKRVQDIEKFTEEMGEKLAALELAFHNVELLIGTTLKDISNNSNDC